MTTGPRHIPGITIHAVAPGADIRVHIQPAQSPAAELSAKIERVWNEHRAANDRLYDGPMLRCIALDAEIGELLCRRDTFRSVVASPRLGLGVRQLGVSGVITAHDATGAEHILLGRRAADTRIYPGQWEFAPAGGVKPPPPNVDTLTLHDLAFALAEEADEELGMTLDPAAASLVAILRDETASSDDAILRFHLADPINPRRAGACPLAAEASGRWEYTDSAWIALPDLPAFARDHARAISPPTLALFQWLGWMT